MATKSDIREPKQKRSIDKKNRIIQKGFELICKKGYYNTNTVDIAKESGVSTGIIYQYFKDKHDILLEGLKTYSDSLFNPIIEVSKQTLDKNNLKQTIQNLINLFIQNHKLSKTAHEELMAISHLDKEVANIFYAKELEITNLLTNLLLEKGFNNKNLKEKVHTSMHLIDDLCHEIVYHRHKNIDYSKLNDITIEAIIHILK